MPPDFPETLPRPPKLTGMNVVALQRADGERYVFIYDDESLKELIRIISCQAANKELSLTWRDCAILVRQAKNIEASSIRG